MMTNLEVIKKNTTETINFMKEYVQHTQRMAEKKIEAEKNNRIFDESTEFFNIDNFTNDEDTMVRIDSIRKTIKALHNTLNEEVEKLNLSYSSIYGNDVTPLDTEVIVHYHSNRGNGKDVYFAFSDGHEIEYIPSNAYIIEITSKNEKIYVPIGYIFSKGALLTEEYDIKVASNNKTISKTLTQEIAIDILKGIYYTKHYRGNNYNWRMTDALEKIDAYEFIKTMFGREVHGISLGFLKQNYPCNKSAETIIKCAPLNSIEKLLSIDVDEAKPIYQIIGITKEAYNLAVEKNLLNLVIEMRKYIVNKEKFKYTDIEWLDIIESGIEYDKDLEFYHINPRIGWGNHSDLSVQNVAFAYSRHEEFYENYTFGKFYQYVINATIDQGYTRVEDYIDDLRDYISMAMKNNAKPIFETTYLKMSHDVAKRNYQIVVTEEEEKAFVEAYKNVKEYKKGKFAIVLPKTSDDIKAEGNSLNHCVASYIHRVLKGECNILFMRHIDKTDESFITVELRNGNICQYKGKNNRSLTDEEKDFLKGYAEEMEYGFL